MAEQITDLYVLLRADNGQLIGGFAEAGVSGEEMSAKIAAVTTEVEAEIVRMNESLVSVGAAADEMALASNAAFEKMSYDTNKLSLDMEAMAAKSAAANEAMAASMDKTAAQMDVDASSSLATSAKVSGLVGLMGAAVVGVTAKMAGDFESATTRLMTSAGESKDNIDVVRQGILDMAGSVGESATDLANAMYTVDGATYHGADSLKILKAAAQGARMENADLKTVTDAVTTTMVDYHLGADQATTVTSQLVTAISEGKSNFQEFSSALHSVTPIASELGVPLADITAALASMTVHGMSADQASQNLANSLRALMNPSSIAINELAQLGINSQDLTAQLSQKGLTGTLEGISTAIMQKMGPSGKILLDAFNQSKVAAQGADQALKAMPPAVQEMANQFKSGALDIANYTKEAKALPGPQGNIALQWLSMEKNANGFNNVLKGGGSDVQNYTQALAKATGGATGLNVALMLTDKNAEGVSKAVKDVSAATGDAAGNVKGWDDIQGTFNQKMAEAKAALGAVAVKIGTEFLPVLSKLAGALGDVADWLSKHPTLLKALAIGIGIVTIAALAFAAAMVVVNIVLYANPIVLIIAAIVAAIVVVIVILTVIVYEIVTHWQDICDFFVNLWNTIKDAFSTAIHWIGDRIGEFIDWVKGIPGKVGNAISSLGDKIGSIAKDAWNSFTKFVSDGFQAALKYFKEFPQKSVYALGYLIGLLAKVAKDAFNGFIDAVVNGFWAVVNWFKALPDTIKGILVNANAWLKVTGDNIIRGLENAILEKYQDIKRWWNNLGPSIVGMLTDAKNWLVKTGSDIIDGAGHGIHDAYVSVKDWFNNLGPNIKGFFGDAINWLYNVGRDILTGLWNGIKSLAGWIGDQISSLVGSLVSGVKAGFDSHSPSRVFHAIGEDLMHGLGNGINAKAGMVVDMARKAAGDIVDGASMDGFTVDGSIGLKPGAGGVAKTGSSNHQTVININVAGNIRTTQQLVREVQQELLRYGIRNVGNGATYTGFGGA